MCISSMYVHILCNIVTSIPHLIGFLGMYCFTEERPVNLIIASLNLPLCETRRGPQTLGQVINERPYISQAIPVAKSSVVPKVKIERNLPEAIHGNPICDWGVKESGVECCKVSNSHQNTKTSPQLPFGCLLPGGIFLLSYHLLRI